MSVISNFKQVSPFMLKKLISDPSLIFPFLFNYKEGDYETTPIAPPEEDVASIDIDKTWAGLHFLLTKIALGDFLPLANVIIANNALDKEIGYGLVHYLTAMEVKEVAKALSQITERGLIKHFDPDAMNEAEIYPGWQISDEKYLLEYYRILVDYYKDAASRGNGMLIYQN